MRRRVCLCVAALAIDAGLSWQQADGVFPERDAWLVLLARGAACLLFSLALGGLLPACFDRPAPAFRLFAFTAAFFIPLLGMAGILLCVMPALHRGSRVRAAEGRRHVRLPGLALQAVASRSSSTVTGAGNLSGALRYARDPQRRLAVLIATLALEGRHATPLLRLALKDPADDVRLLAYILLNRRENVIVERIGARTSQLHAATGEHAFDLHKALAHDYRELAFLAAATGSAAASSRARAREHALSGLQLRARDIDLQLLCGRIALHDRQLDAAGDAFSAARQAGLADSKTSPFLAEIAFLRHCYAEVNEHLAHAAHSGSQLGLHRQSAYWRAK